MKDVIVIPTYNEGENVNALVSLIFETVPDIHVLIADDNSPDGTAALVGELQKKYPNLGLISQSEKKGLGKAYINAFNHVLSDKEVETVFMMDADFSHQPRYIPKMLELRKQYSVVIGSRYVKGGGVTGWELWRRLMSLFGNFYCRTVTRLPIRDCTGGFNAISTDLLRKLDFSVMDMSGYAFIMELKYLLHKAGGTFAEIPIIFVNRTGGESKMSSHIINEGVLAPWKMVLK